MRLQHAMAYMMHAVPKSAALADQGHTHGCAYANSIAEIYMMTPL